MLIDDLPDDLIGRHDERYSNSAINQGLLSVRRRGKKVLWILESLFAVLVVEADFLAQIRKLFAAEFPSVSHVTGPPEIV